MAANAAWCAEPPAAPSPRVAGASYDPGGATVLPYPARDPSLASTARATGTQRAPTRHMRLRTLIKVLALGLAARAITRYVRDNRAAPRGPARDSFAPDPADPVQGLDEVIELGGAPLTLDAQSLADIEGAQDLAALEIEVDRIAGADDAQIELVDIDDLAITRDGGELYGAQPSAAVERAYLDDDQALAEGQNWIEALETRAIENGAEPEQELSALIDDDDLFGVPHASIGRDTPVADHGSGGRRGL